MGESRDAVDINTAARFLCLGKSTVYRLVASRSIPFIKYGKGRIAFLMDELDEWRKAQRLVRQHGFVSAEGR